MSEQAEEKTKAKQGSKLKPVLIVLLLLIGAGGWYYTHQTASPLAEEPFVQAVPSIVVNLEDRNPRHYLKVSPSIVTHHIALSKKLPAYIPQVRNFMIREFRRESVVTLSKPDSFERVRAKTLKGLKKLLQQQIGMSAVDDLLFTEFVIQ